MAVAFDAASSGALAAKGTSLTFALTVGAGSDRALLVFITVSFSAGFVSVTYAGVAMTLVVARSIPSDGDNMACYRLEAPSSGANNVVITYGTAHIMAAGAISVTGADQTNCVSASATATGTSAAPSATVASAVGELVVGSVGSFSGVTCTQGTGETERWDQAGSGGGESATNWGGTEAGAASVTIAPTMSANQEWGAIAASIKASGGGGGGGKPFSYYQRMQLANYRREQHAREERVRRAYRETILRRAA